MQRYSFCRIENLAVKGGEPAFHPPPLVSEDIRLGASNGPRPELSLDDFVLRAPVIEFFEHLQRLGEGRIALIEVRHGLPIRLVIEQPVSGEEP
jgi:hypothetical protein